MVLTLVTEGQEVKVQECTELKEPDKGAGSGAVWERLGYTEDGHELRKNLQDHGN